MIILHRYDEHIMTPFGVKPTEPRAGIAVNHFFNTTTPPEIVHMPNNAMLWFIGDIRYMVEFKWCKETYGPPWMITAVWEWRDTNKFYGIDKLIIPTDHPAIKFFQEYLKDPL